MVHVVRYINLELFIRFLHPLINLFVSFIFFDAIALLYASGKLFTFTFDLVPVIIGKLAPFLNNLTL